MRFTECNLSLVFSEVGKPEFYLKDSNENNDQQQFQNQIFKANRAVEYHSEYIHQLVFLITECNLEPILSLFLQNSCTNHEKEKNQRCHISSKKV